MDESRQQPAAQRSSGDELHEILDFAQAMVRRPSRAIDDDPAEIISLAERWCVEHSLPPEILMGDSGQPVGLYAVHEAAEPGPSICLNACIDTAGWGNLASWKLPPTSGKIVDSWLHGRGSGDSKTAAAIFLSLLNEARRTNLVRRGRLIVLLDAYEHSGEFSGIKTFLTQHRKPVDAFLIGYPGNREIQIGARGFLRAKIAVHGQSCHSGSRSLPGVNAVLKAAELAQLIAAKPLSADNDPDFPIPPRISVTAIQGGGGFSQIPDAAEINVDVRITPPFGETEARHWLSEAVSQVDRSCPSPRPTSIEYVGSWPAYRLQEELPLLKLFGENAQAAFGRQIPFGICGPSNVGNLLSIYRIPATCGFGVTCENIHAPNERIEISSIGPVTTAYRETVRGFLA